MSLTVKRWKSLAMPSTLLNPLPIIAINTLGYTTVLSYGFRNTKKRPSISKRERGVSGSMRHRILFSF